MKITFIPIEERKPSRDGLYLINIDDTVITALWQNNCFVDQARTDNVYKASGWKDISDELSKGIATYVFTITDEAIKSASQDDILRVLGNAVYAGTALIERCERLGKIKADGHHLRQECSERACSLLEECVWYD